KCVVTPDDGSSLAASIFNPRLQGAIVEAGPRDARTETDGLDELLDVQKHHVSVTLAISLEVMPVLLTVIEQHAGRLELIQIAGRITVGNVGQIVLMSFQVGDEHDTKIIGRGNLAKILVGLVLG